MTGSAATLPHQGFAISTNNYDDGDNSFSGTSVYLRKTLSQDRLSLKMKLASLGITEDAPRNQVLTSAPYSETENDVVLGMDYLYYDSSLSLSTSYSQVASSSMADISFNLTQEYNNGANYMLLGFGNAWENDSDLGMYNEKRHLDFGSKFGMKPYWTLFTGIEFTSANGDLENFRSARRYNLPNRTVLPDSRSDRKLKVTNIFDRGKNRYLTLDLAFLKNDWGQTGKDFKISFLKIRSQHLSVTTHFRMYNLSQSDYYFDNIVAISEPYYSDHQTLAKQKSREIGIAGDWLFTPRKGKRLNNFKLGGGFNFSQTEYDTADNVSNTGKLLFVNLSGDF